MALPSAIFLSSMLDKNLISLHRSCEADCVRHELVRRHWTSGHLAQICGYSVLGFQVQLCNGFTGKPIRYAIEAAFGYALAIWSTPTELEVRSACKNKHGVDPFLLTKDGLVQFARKLGILSVTTIPSKALLLDSVMSRLVADTNLLSPSNSKHPI